MLQMLVLTTLQVRRRRRRCGRKDMSSYQLYHEQVPLGICPYSLRQLRRDRHVSLLLLFAQFGVAANPRWI